MVHICSVANIGHLCSEQCLTSLSVWFGSSGAGLWLSFLFLIFWLHGMSFKQIDGKMYLFGLHCQNKAHHYISRSLVPQSPQNVQTSSGWIMLPFVIIPCFFFFLFSKTSRTSVYCDSSFFLVGFCLDSLFYYFSDFWGGSGVQLLCKWKTFRV